MRLHRAACVCLLLGACLLRADKEYKGAEEHQLHTAVAKHFAANDMPAALAALDAWKRKFPGSEFASNRQELYVQAHARASRPAEAIAAAKPVLAGPFDTQDDRLRLIYTVTSAVQQLPAPDAEQRATGAEAARQLMAFDSPPAGTNPEDWQKARKQLQTAAAAALIHIALTPVREAVKAGECTSAEAAALNTAGAYPASVQAAWVLGSAQLCLARTKPEKFPAALYALARAASLDPVEGMVDPAWQKNTAAPYLEKVYAQYHGPDPRGLEELKKIAMKSPLPPEGFVILSAVQVEQKRQAEFESKNPEVALWMRIKAALTAPSGENYYSSELKGVAVPPLVGTLVEAQPACRPTSLLVAIPQPGSSGAPAEIVLKLAQSLPGKPEPGATIRFEGVPSAFTREPFLLTMQSEPVKVTGLKLTPCGVPRPAKR